MSVIQSRRRARLVALAAYLRVKSDALRADGQKGAGLRTWANDLDAILKSHGEDEP